MKRSIPLILCVILAATALVATGCTTGTAGDASATVKASDFIGEYKSSWIDIEYNSSSITGEGAPITYENKVSFTLSIKDDYTFTLKKFYNGTEETSEEIKGTWVAYKSKGSCDILCLQERTDNDNKIYFGLNLLQDGRIEANPSMTTNNSSALTAFGRQSKNNGYYISLVIFEKV